MVRQTTAILPVCFCDASQKFCQEFAHVDSKFGRIVRHTTGSHNDCPSQIIIVNGEVFPKHIRSHTVSHHKIRNTRIFFLDHRAQCMHVCDHRVTRIFRKYPQSSWATESPCPNRSCPTTIKPFSVRNSANSL